MRAKFLSPEHTGPLGVADFLEVTESEERAIVARDAYERVNAMLDGLGIGPWEDAGAVYKKVCEATVEVLRQTWPGMAAGAPRRIPQAEADATYCCARTPENGRIDWTADTRTVFNLIRGLARPFPGAFTVWEEGQLRIWRAEPVAEAQVYVGRVPGRVVGVDRTKGHIDVLTGDGVLRLLEVQPDGAEEAGSPTQWVRSVRARLG